MNKSTCNVDESGDKTWKDSNGECHRVDGPAVEHANGTKIWYIHGRFHRVDGPAVEFTNGYKAWYTHGQCHRVDGPAIERANGEKEYWYKDKQISKDRYYSKEFQDQLVMES